MDSTEGAVRGQPVEDTGAPITVPVGPETLGRILNVIGQPVDDRPPVQSKLSYPIHRSAPEYIDQSTEAEILVTGIKVIDLLAPYAKRSEEHTSELQSLMRISYAVFCLKKKKTKDTTPIQRQLHR